MDKTQKFYFHHSSHGQTTLHKLLVDKDRREKIILAKYGIPDIAQGRVDFYDISYNTMYQMATRVIGEQGIQELFLKHREEMEQIPLVDFIEGLPYGKRLEVVYKVRGLQGHSVLAGDFSSDPEDEEFPEKKYHNYITIHALGNSENRGIVHKVILHKGRTKKVFFDLDSGIAVNLPGILHDYVADFKVGLFELLRNKEDSSDKKLYVKVDESDTPIKYAGASFKISQNAYLHSFSPESSGISAINTLINGTGNVNWDPSIYQRYYGFKREIRPETEKIILTIFGSHCLNLQEFEDYGDIGNVIPFMLDSSPEWYEMFKDDLYMAAEEEVEYQREKLEEVDKKLKDAERELEETMVERQDAVLDMTRLLRNSSDQYLLRPRSDSYHSSDLSDLNEGLSIDKDEVQEYKYNYLILKQKFQKSIEVLTALQFIKKKELGPIQSKSRRDKALSLKPEIKKKKRSNKKKK